MKKISLVTAFVLCGTICFGQKQKKDSSIIKKADSIDIVVIRMTTMSYQQLVQKIDSLNVPHPQVRDIFRYIDNYSIERVPIKKP